MTGQREMNRRAMLSQVGGGFGGLAARLDALSRRPAGSRPSGPTTFPQRAPKASASSRCSWPGRGERDRPVRLQARAHEAATASQSDFGEPVETFQNGLGPVAAAAVGVPRPTASAANCSATPWRTSAACVDEMAFVHNVVGKTGVHRPGHLPPGDRLSSAPASPAWGWWVSYGLGSLNENLPTFVVLPDHRGFASNGPKNWDCGLPPRRSIKPATVSAGREDADRRPRAPADRGDVHHAAQRRRRASICLATLNRQHADDLPRRLAARRPHPQLRTRRTHAARRAGGARPPPRAGTHPADVRPRSRQHDHPRSTEINAAQETDYFGRKCLVARRLLERGVRFVQIWSGTDNGFPRRNWDSHEDVDARPRPARPRDRPAARRR